jgi:RNA polymerase sigma-70 factor, ECF subfamily
MTEKELKNIPDDRLIEGFQSTGNKDFISTLFMRYAYLVMGVCLNYFQDREASKDAMMQIFEKLLIALPGQEIRNFGSWLYVLSKNHCLMQLRSEKASLIRNRKWMEDQEKIVESEFSVHPLDNDSSLQEKQLADCLEKLKEEQRNCIRMFYYEDLCYREIAERTKEDEKNVKSNLQNGKRNLKLCLESKHV